MTKTNLTDTVISTIRDNFGSLDADLSRACSEALWGDTTRIRNAGRRTVWQWLVDRG